MAHLWQRFLLASALVVGLAIGVAATVFGYSNLGTVDLHWSVFHLEGVPLWTVAVVPIAFLLIAGTIYHWLDGLHHFSEHMRHRHRVRDLEAEVARLRAHLDQVLEMPRGGLEPAKVEEKPSLLPATTLTAEADDAMSGLDAEPEPSHEAEAAPAATADADKPKPDRKKRARIIMEPEPQPAATNGVEAEPAAFTAQEG